MDLLRDKYEEEFSRRRVTGASQDKKFRAMKVTMHGEYNVQDKLWEDAAKEAVDDELQNDPTILFIKAFRGEIYMSIQDFLSVFKTFKLDRYVLHLITQDSYGFYAMPTEDDQTIFIGTNIYALTFSATHPTKAICLLRNRNDLGRTENEVMKELKDILRVYVRHRNENSYLLVVVLMHLLQFCDELLNRKLKDIRQIEATTGHGPGGEDGPNLWETSRRLGELRDKSREPSNLTAHLSSVVRHHAIAMSILEHVKNPGPELDAALKVLKQRLEGNSKMVKYLQERSESQPSVISVLISHQDAQVSIGLAEAGNDLSRYGNKLAEYVNELAESSNKLAEYGIKLAESSENLTAASAMLAEAMDVIFVYNGNNKRLEHALVYFGIVE